MTATTDRRTGESADERLLSFLADALHERSAGPRRADDELAGAICSGRFAVLADRLGLEHPSFAAQERKLFVTTSLVIEVSAWCIELLRAAGVRAATYKGPAMAVQLFGDPVVRPSSDVDLLVAPDDLPRARAALVAAGLRPAERYPDWYERRWHYHELLLGTPEHGSLPVELHWSFARPGLIGGDVVGVLDELDDVPCGSRLLPAPALPWQLVACAVHAVQHYFTPRPLFDVALLARRLDEAGWFAVARLARRLRLEPSLYYAVTVSARRLRWRPPALIESLRPPAWRDAVVQAALARLPLVAFPGAGGRQAMKAITPLACVSGNGWLKGLAYQVSDRPRLAAAARRVTDGARGRGAQISATD